MGINTIIIIFYILPCIISFLILKGLDYVARKYNNDKNTNWNFLRSFSFVPVLNCVIFITILFATIDIVVKCIFNFIKKRQ